MFKRVLNELKARIRAAAICLQGFSRKTLFYPFAKVSSGGTIQIGRGAGIKKVFLNAGSGEIWIGDHVWMNDGTELSASRKITVGDGTTIQRNVTINGNVTIGNECLFAPNVFVSSASHVHDRYPGVSIREQERRISREEFLALYDKPIFIGDDVWLGANAVLMPGITVGAHAIVGANAVVTRDVPVGAIVVGSPAKVIKFRSGFEGASNVE